LELVEYVIVSPLFTNEAYLFMSLKTLSFLALFLTIPLLPSTPFAGLPLWAWASIGMSLVYALVLILFIEKSWEDESNDG